MARKRKRKPTISQALIGVATTGMPQPVRAMLGNRLVSSLVMIAAPILLVTGVVSIQWDGTLPKVSVDQQRAQQIRAQAKESLQRLREKEDGLLTSWPRRDESKEASEPESSQHEQPIANLSEILRTLR
ncbi:MAG TPA: hypothetical protein PLF81_05220 [Candidatus Anammoximicrobium sp.]|nr:hypothetical protein [Candidatus Anammoximicrobium sp.]